VPSYYRDPSAPTPNVPRKVGVTALITRDETILVERRVDDPDVWAFIGGTLEETETILDTLYREVREETGFDVEAAALLGIFSDPERIAAHPDGSVCRVLSIAFQVTVAGGAEPCASSESGGMRFVDFSELEALPFWAIHRPIREAFLASSATPVTA
jgi:ADP-ribose pyrophosphatase YjhB (NUDIX family)